MTKFHLIFSLLLIMLTACAGDNAATPPPATPAFPTVTPGAEAAFAADFPGNLVARDAVSNPATLAARAVLPTPTADTSACPTPGNTDATLPASAPATEGEIVNEVLNFLNIGGDVATLEDTISRRWGLLGDAGFFRTDTDLTNEGVPEIIISHSVPIGGTAILVIGCANQRYIVRHQDISEANDPPQIIQITDLNRSGFAEMVYVNPDCDDADPEDCIYETNIVSWQPSLGRFVSVLGSQIIYSSWPNIIDRDNDGVDELILTLDNQGDATTGPLRTGISTYDWNGTVYVLSIWEPDPPRFRVQYVHQADRYFLDGDMALAMTLYDQVLNDPDLRAWRNNEDDILRAYSLYRALVAQVIIGQQGDLTIVYQRINDTFPTDDIVYAQMSRIFFEAYGVAADISQACTAVRELIDQRPEALDLINRYGERSPTYTVNDMCPF